MFWGPCAYKPLRGPLLVHGESLVAHVVALVAYRFSIQNHCRAKQHSVFVRQSYNRLFRCAIIVLRNSTYCAVTILVRTQYFARLRRSYAALPILLSSLLAQKRRSGGRGALVGFSGKCGQYFSWGPGPFVSQVTLSQGPWVPCRVSDGSTASDDWLPLSLRWPIYSLSYTHPIHYHPSLISPSPSRACQGSQHFAVSTPDHGAKTRLGWG